MTKIHIGSGTRIKLRRQSIQLISQTIRSARSLGVLKLRQLMGIIVVVLLLACPLLVFSIAQLIADRVILHFLFKF